MTQLPEQLMENLTKAIEKISGVGDIITKQTSEIAQLHREIGGMRASLDKIDRHLHGDHTGGGLSERVALLERKQEQMHRIEDDIEEMRRGQRKLLYVILAGVLAGNGGQIAYQQLNEQEFQQAREMPTTASDPAPRADS